MKRISISTITGTGSPFSVPGLPYTEGVFAHFVPMQAEPLEPAFVRDLFDRSQP